MEEDIKILKQFKEFLLTIGIPSCKFEKEIQAIDNMLYRLEQDERVIEEMAEYISDFDIDETICKKKTDDCYMDVYIVNGCKECIIDHFRKKCE